MTYCVYSDICDIVYAHRSCVDPISRYHFLDIRPIFPIFVVEKGKENICRAFATKNSCKKSIVCCIIKEEGMSQKDYQVKQLIDHLKQEGLI